MEGRYEPNYPPTVELIGTHPVVYSANGSHGLWGSPGQKFMLIPLVLIGCLLIFQ